MGATSHDLCSYTNIAIDIHALFLFVLDSPYTLYRYKACPMEARHVLRLDKKSSMSVKKRFILRVLCLAINLRSQILPCAPSSTVPFPPRRKRLDWPILCFNSSIHFLFTLDILEALFSVCGSYTVERSFACDLGTETKVKSLKSRYTRDAQG